MKLSWRVELVQLAIIAAMFGVAAWAWPQVPERLPIHWNIRGQVDGWGGKFAGLLLMPLITVGIYALMLVVPLIDPRSGNYQNFAKAYNAIRITFTFFMATIYGLMVVAAFGRPINITTIIPLATGLLFFVIGNFMSKLRPNWIIGVRTPWTLSSTLSWNKTHRLAGWLFLLMGLFLIALAVIPNVWMLMAMLVVDAVCVVWMFVYSYLVYRDDPERSPPGGMTTNAE
jgi:immunity protein, SdpI family